ncbi:MAG: helix-hairpin-helix domain-containing protein [Spirochaetes bacterium]|nr:helix-hairpin-helix domain-containing protein [Spirochaetota bacterium]
MKRSLLLSLVSFVLVAFIGSAATPTTSSKSTNAKAATTTAAAKASTNAAAPAKTAVTNAAAVKTELIDINSATAAELKKLPGIGDAYSKKIIAGRPYANKTQLKTKGALPDSVYEKIADLVTAKQK